MGKRRNPDNVGKATFVKRLDYFSGDARLYAVEPAHEGWRFVIVSKINNDYGHETGIFPAYADGKLAYWSEMAGSMKGECSHEEVLSGIGYEVSRHAYEQLARWLADNGASRLQITAESPSPPDTPHTAQDAPQPPQ
jgi:NAD(P)-dependent dehydrogenase (short-subunit alcohol dehydrogenase family)